LAPRLSQAHLKNFYSSLLKQNQQKKKPIQIEEVLSDLQRMQADSNPNVLA